MLNLNHKKLDVWNESILFVKTIYELTSTFPASENYGLVSQLRRAAISISSNVAEGAARKSANERKRFFEIARSSLVEIDTQLELGIILNYIKKEDLEGLEDQLNKIFGMLSRLIERTR